MASVKFEPGPSGSAPPINHHHSPHHQAANNNNDNNGIYLATKLRKIKNKLDESGPQPNSEYQRMKPQQPPPPPPQPVNYHQFNSTKHFQFELNTNPTSFDHLFDQFKLDLAQHTTSSPNKSNCNQEDALAAVSLRHVQYSENISRQSSIRSLVNNDNRVSGKPPPIKNSLGVLDKHEYALIADWDAFNKKSNTNSANNAFIPNKYYFMFCLLNDFNFII